MWTASIFGRFTSLSQIRSPGTGWIDWVGPRAGPDTVFLPVTCLVRCQSKRRRRNFVNISVTVKEDHEACQCGCRMNITVLKLAGLFGFLLRYFAAAVNRVVRRASRDARQAPSFACCSVCEGSTGAHASARVSFNTVSANM
jgi:hypothetical protein